MLLQNDRDLLFRCVSVSQTGLRVSPWMHMMGWFVFGVRVQLLVGAGMLFSPALISVGHWRLLRSGAEPCIADLSSNMCSTRCAGYLAVPRRPGWLVGRQ